MFKCNHCFELVFLPPFSLLFSDQDFWYHLLFDQINQILQFQCLGFWAVFHTEQLNPLIWRFSTSCLSDGWLQRELTPECSSWYIPLQGHIVLNFSHPKQYRHVWSASLFSTRKWKYCSHPSTTTCQISTITIFFMCLIQLYFILQPCKHSQMHWGGNWVLPNFYSAPISYHSNWCWEDPLGLELLHKAFTQNSWCNAMYLTHFMLCSMQRFCCAVSW